MGYLYLFTAHELDSAVVLSTSVGVFTVYRLNKNHLSYTVFTHRRI